MQNLCEHCSAKSTLYWKYFTFSIKGPDDLAENLFVGDVQIVWHYPLKLKYFFSEPTDDNNSY